MNSANEVLVEHGSGQTEHVVIWLHGLGADGHDFEPIVPELRLPEDVRVRFVFPHAPVRPVTLNGGMPMRAWYDIISIDSNRNEDETGIREAAKLVEGLIDRERSAGVPAERIVLAGFSQGGAMAYHVGLRYPEKLAGIMVLSAYLLLEDRLAEEASDANKSTPILQCHGTWDPVVPMTLGESARHALSVAGYSVDWRTYPVPHGVDPDEIRHIGEWLTKIFDHQ